MPSQTPLRSAALNATTRPLHSSHPQNSKYPVPLRDEIIAQILSTVNLVSQGKLFSKSLAIRDPNEQPQDPEIELTAHITSRQNGPSPVGPGSKQIGICKMIDALHPPFRRIIPFSLLVRTEWLTLILDIYRALPPEFLVTEIDFLSTIVASSTRPNQVIFFSMLEIIRLISRTPYDEIQWASFDAYLSDVIVGWRNEVRRSKGISPYYISKIKAYINIDITPTDLPLSQARLDEWTNALLLKIRPIRPLIHLPWQERLEIYYLAIAANRGGSHFPTMEEIEAHYLLSITDGDVTGLHLLHRVCYLTRQFSFILLDSSERRKDKAKTEEFLSKLADIAEAGVFTWSCAGPSTSAGEILEIMEVMESIDDRLAKAGFKDGVFLRAKVRVMRWCCLQKWFQRSVEDRHPDWFLASDGTSMIT